MGVFDSGYRSESEIFVDQILHNRVVFAQCDMHLHGSLTVPNVVNFLVGQLVDVGEDGRKVKVSHMLEGKIPKFLIFVRIVLGVVPRMFVSSAIAKPNIVALVGKHEARCFIFIIENPGIRTVSQPMH